MHAIPTPEDRTPRHAATRTLAILLLLAAGPARAEAEASAGPAPWAEKPYALVLDGAFGPVNTEGEWGLALDAVLRLQAASLAVGLVAGGGGAPLGRRWNDHYGLVAGLRHPVSEVLRLELLGEAGLDRARLCAGLFAPGGCASATLPYVGLRAGADLRFGGRLAFVLGAWTVLRADLRRERLSSESVDLGQAGGASLAFQGRLGIELGFGD